MKHTDKSIKEKLDIRLLHCKNKISARLHCRTLHFVLEVNPSPLQLTDRKQNMTLRTVLTELPRINDTKSPVCCVMLLKIVRNQRHNCDGIKRKVLLLPLVEMFSKVGGQQAADAVVRQEHVEVSQQTALGFEWFVLRLQDIVWDDLLRTQENIMTMAAVNRRTVNH